MKPIFNHKNWFLCTFLSIITSILFAQNSDTIRMMQYNLMYYTNTSGVSDCNSLTNNLDTKDANIKTIFDYVKPTVFCVCELGSDNEYADRILNNVLNTGSTTYYKRGPLTNLSGGHIANMIYYDSRKLEYYNYYTVTTAYRDINGYKFYYKSNDLAHGDTIFMTFWIAHLKAGSAETNENQRLVQVQRLMNKISGLGEPGNYFFSGDFNFYSSSEPAFKELTEYSNSLYRFYDPTNSPGNWHNNSQFTSLHTQSTHTQSDGCFVTGGLDDRFDFILVSPYVYFGSDKISIIDNSYHALGQDGSRFNGSIISPANNSIPSNVANALYQQSDHLPVIMDLKIDATVKVDNRNFGFFANIVNPVNDKLTIELQSDDNQQFSIDIFSIDGRLAAHYNENFESGFHRFDYRFPFPKGMYLITITDERGQKTVKKVVH